MTSAPAGTSPTPVTGEMLLERARHIADVVLFPDAQAIDRAELIDRDRFAPFAEAGLFGMAEPSSIGPVGLTPSMWRRIAATIGGGCGARFFSWVQHHGVVRTMSASPNDDLRSELLADLCSGHTMAGVAFAHVRREGRRAIEASRVDGGWRLDGFAPWATSWGIADVFAIAAESSDGELVWAIVPGSEAPGVRPIPLALPVFSSTGTVALEFDALVVPDERIALVEDVGSWRAGDRVRASIGQPAVLGVADRAIRLLADAARGDDDPVHDAVGSLRRRLDRRWRTDDETIAVLANEPSDAVITSASDHRAACLTLARDATTALTAAVGGAAMDRSHPAQRLVREAAFYVIQAQTADGRAGVLRSIAGHRHG